ncbi:MAG: biotin/lipoyl-containing protein [Bacteroidota bacterium]|nr:biotin/lipoyl-containing protein [Bacteroidota bacterium]
MEQKKDLQLVDFAVTARKYKTTLTKKFINRKQWEKAVEGEIKAFLPGTILSVFVKEGQTVKAGTVLLIHEAMKMQNKVIAPHDGKVVTLAVKAGDKVSKNEVLVVFE